MWIMLSQVLNKGPISRPRNVLESCHLQQSLRYIAKEIVANANSSKTVFNAISAHQNQVRTNEASISEELSLISPQPYAILLK
jgi:hypothetical protein